MKKLNKILLTLSSFTLVFSTLANVSINVSAVEAQNNTAVSSVKEAISKLIDSKNYTVEVSTKVGPLDMNYNIYYTENGFYDNFLGDEYGYVEVDEGVFSFNLYNRKFTASKLLEDENGDTITSLWDSDLIPSFKGFRINQFKNATGKEYTSSAKIDQINMLQILKLDITNYNIQNTVKFSVDNSVNGLKIEYNLQNGKNYVCTIKDFGTTKIDVIDNYLKENTYHKTSQDLQHIIGLFDDFNYTRIMYSDDERLSNPIIGYEYFNENYFIGDVSAEAVSLSLIIPTASVFSIQETFDEVETIGETTFGPYEFSGCYYGALNDNGEIDALVVSFPINEDPYIPNVFNYPTFLKMFTQPQYLQATGVENQFYTSKVDLVEDFVNNFQQGDSLTSVGAKPSGVYVNYLPKGDGNKYPGTENKETVVFGLEVVYFGKVEVIDFVMTDFGNTVFEKVTKENIRAYIQNIIDNAKDKAREELSASDGADSSN